jgi:hypothetical protein
MAAVERASAPDGPRFSIVWVIIALALGVCVLAHNTAAAWGGWRLAVLGPKPSGLDVRPDQVDLIGLATRHVGLDLHALKVEQLERKVMLLEAKLDGALAATPQPA